MKKRWRWDSFDDIPEDKNETPDDGQEGNDSDLAHHGILGMKWGIRRTPEQLGHKTSSKTKLKVTTTKKSSYEKKMEKLATQEQRIAEKEAIKAKSEELKWRKAELNDASKKAAEKEAAKSKKKEEKAAKQKAKEDEAKANKKTDSSASKSAKSLTDEELRAIISRYNLEKQYNQITKEQTQTGKSWVIDMLSQVGKEVAKEYTKKAVTGALSNAIEKAKKKQNSNSGSEDLSGLSDEELRDAINRHDLEERYRRIRGGGSS